MRVNLLIICRGKLGVLFDKSVLEADSCALDDMRVGLNVEN